MSQLTDILLASHRGGWPFRNPPNVAFRLNQNSPQAEGLEGWWPLFIGKKSNIIPDLLGRGVAGTLINGPTWSTSAERGLGVEFDSNNDAIAIANPGNIDPSYSSLTISFWLRWDGADGGNQYIIGKREGWPNVRWQLFYSNGDGDLQWQSGVALKKFTVAPTSGKTQHIVVTQDGTNCYLYIDGVFQNSQTAITSVSSASDHVTIGNIWVGAAYYTQAFNGAIYEARVRNKFLGASEVWQEYSNPWELYAPEISIFYSIPVAAAGAEYYQAAEGSITTVGTIIKSGRKVLVGASTFSGAIAKKTSKSFTGSSTLVGSLIKQSQKAFTGVTTASGVLIGRAGKVLTGSITASGVLVRAITKSFTGSLTAVGTLVKQTAKAFVGAITAIGSLATQKITGGYFQAVGGVLTMSGIVVKQTNKIFTGSVTTVGTLVKQTAKAFTGSITTVGTLTALKSMFQVIGGALTMAGGLIRQTSKQTAGIVTMAGSITKRISKTFTGVLTTVGALARQLLGLPTPYDQTFAIEAENRVYAIT